MERKKTATAVDCENTKLWNSVVDTPPEYLKEFKRAGGFAGKSIDPTYRIRKLTEVFGPVGKGWGFIQEDQWSDGGSGAYVVYVRGHIWYMLDGERYMTNSHTGGTVCDRAPDEAYKMAETDALGKCCVDLGLSCDVYMGEHDGDKYQRPEAGKAYSPNLENAGRRPAGQNPTVAPQARAREGVRAITEDEVQNIGIAIRNLTDEGAALKFSQQLFHRCVATVGLPKEKALLTGVMAERRCQLATVDSLQKIEDYLKAVVQQKWITKAQSDKYLSLTKRRLGLPPETETEKGTE